MKTIKKKPVFQQVAAVVKVPLHLCESAEYNPDRRSEENYVMSLAHSISTEGQKVPVHLYWNLQETKLEVAEGHRRIQALHVLNQEYVNAIVHPYAAPEVRARAYAAINGEVKKHAEADKLFSYLKNSMAVDMWYQARFSKMVKLIGKELAWRMVGKNKGWSFYSSRCKKISEWVGITDIKAFVVWMLDVPGAEAESRKIYEMRKYSGNGSLKVYMAFKKNVAPCCGAAA
jgi:hypothetical protein